MNVYDERILLASKHAYKLNIETQSKTILHTDCVYLYLYRYSRNGREGNVSVVFVFVFKILMLYLSVSV